MKQSALTSTPEVQEFIQGCQRVAPKIKKRVRVEQSHKRNHARAYLWCNWLRQNGLMGGDV